MSLIKNNYEKYMYENRREDIMKDGRHWTQKIKEAGLTDRLLPFNDVLVDNNPPGEKAAEPMLKDVELDGAIVDIYHLEHSNRIYIHRKARTQKAADSVPFYGPKEQKDDMDLEATERP